MRGKDTETRLASARTRATEILSVRGNRLLLIEALSVCCLLAALFTVMQYAVSALSLVIEPILVGLAWYVCIYLFLRFLAAPMLAGTVYMAHLMCRAEEVTLSDLFFFWSEGRLYRRALRMTSPTVHCAFLAILLPGLTQSVLGSFSLSGVWYVAVLILLIAAELFGLLLLLCISYSRTSHGICTLSSDAAGIGWWRGKRAERPIRRGLRFFGGFFWRILLGLLTFGLLLIADVIPQMLLTYCCDCDTDETI